MFCRLRVKRQETQQLQGNWRLGRLDARRQMRAPQRAVMDLMQILVIQRMIFIDRLPGPLDAHGYQKYFSTMVNQEIKTSGERARRKRRRLRGNQVICALATFIPQWHLQPYVFRRIWLDDAIQTFWNISDQQHSVKRDLAFLCFLGAGFSSKNTMESSCPLNIPIVIW